MPLLAFLLMFVYGAPFYVWIIWFILCCFN